MRPYKSKINPFNGTLQLVPTNIVLAFKEGVISQANLPLSGNGIGDARLANDTGHLYVWSIEADSGLLTDWADAGDIVDLNWSAISGKPSSAVADIDDAVAKRHTQNTDTYLATVVTNKFYVDVKRGDSYTPTGTITKPFKTLQSAIDAVSGASATNKFEINILPGTYTENIVLKSHIVLKGNLDSLITASTGNTITASGLTGVWLIKITVDNTGSGAKFNFTNSTIDFLDCYTPSTVSGTGGGFLISGGVTNLRGGAFGTLSGTTVSLSGGAQLTPVATSFYSYNGDCLVSVASYPILMNVALSSGTGKKDLNADATSVVYWGTVVADMTKVTYTTRLAVLSDILTNRNIEALGTIKSGSSLIIDGTTNTITCSGTTLSVNINSGVRITCSKNTLQFDGEAGVTSKLILNNNTLAEFYCNAGAVSMGFLASAGGYGALGTITNHFFTLIVNSLGLIYLYTDRSVTINEYNLTSGQIPTLKIYGYPVAGLRYTSFGFNSSGDFVIVPSAGKIQLSSEVIITGHLHLSSNNRLNFEGVSGDTYMTYNSVTGKLETWVDGVKKQEL